MERNKIILPSYEGFASTSSGSTSLVATFRRASALTARNTFDAVNLSLGIVTSSYHNYYQFVRWRLAFGFVKSVTDGERKNDEMRCVSRKEAYILLYLPQRPSPLTLLTYCSSSNYYNYFIYSINFVKT
eukprot:scaffold3195_cov63-Skeletonema_marinoi.AAC.1